MDVDALSAYAAPTDLVKRIFKDSSGARFSHEQII
jgi:hypothetical protein